MHHMDAQPAAAARSTWAARRERQGLAKGLTRAKIDYERCARDERITPPMTTYKYYATMMST